MEYSVSGISMNPGCGGYTTNRPGKTMCKSWSYAGRKTKRIAAKRISPEGLSATATPGEGGVTRLEYKTRDGRTLGTARILGTTIGDIEVEEEFRRQGIGTAILQDLKRRGGVSGFAGSEAGAALMKKAGMTETSPGRYSFEGPAVAIPAKKKRDSGYI
jgi:GNAT superfamily N-acetyltransferase